MSGENIRVILRVRPPNSKEIAMGSKVCMQFLDDKTIQLDGKPFSFDAVLPLSTTQKQAYEIIARPIVDQVLNGYNGTIFAYGQTSSGKTHTMQGYAPDAEQKGLIPRIVDDVFNRITNMTGSVQFVIKISYLEIYMEKVKDLFDNTKDNLPIGENKDKSSYVKGLTERYVGSPDEVIDALDEGQSNRKVAETNMNARSSRSHSVFLMTIQSEDNATAKKKTGMIYMVDLAGSEKVGKTGAEGTTLDEAKMINKSLSTLGNVINALVEGHGHVPYRDSKLTRILQNSLGGNSKTTLVICASPAEYNSEETKSTCYFGIRAKSIKNQVTVNEQLTAEEWKRRYDALMAKYRRLQAFVAAIMAENKRWRGGDKVPQAEWVNEDRIKEDMKAMEDQNAPVETPTMGALGFGAVADQAADDGGGGGGGGGASGGKGGKGSKGGGGGGGGAKAPPRGTPPANIDSEALDTLYKELDLKDEELNIKSQAAAKALAELTKVKADLKKAKAKTTASEDELKKYKAEAETSKTEVKEVLSALEELAQNYDQKANDLEKKTEEFDRLQEQLNRVQGSINEKESEAKTAREDFLTQKKQLAETMKGLLDELGEAGEAISPHIGKPQRSKDGSFEAEVITFRLYVGKIKSEASSIQRRIDEAERLKNSQEAELKETREKLTATEIKSREMKGKLDSLKNTYKDCQKARKEAEDKVAALLADISKLEAALQVAQGGGSEENKELWDKMNQQIDAASAMFREESKKNRAEIEKKSLEITRIQAEIAGFQAKLDHANKEKEELEFQLKEKSEKLASLENQADRREDAKRELKGLEDNVIRELQTLHNLRKLFVADLKSRIIKAAVKQQLKGAFENAEGNEQPSVAKSNDEEQYGSLLQRERIAFLENNLDNLTKVHKQLVRDNSDLRTEVPKLEKRLKASMERVRHLENSLKDSRDSAVRDRKRYRVEVDKIKEQVRNRAFRPAAANVIKPIQAGRPTMAYAHTDTDM